MLQYEAKGNQAVIFLKMTLLHEFDLQKHEGFKYIYVNCICMVIFNYIESKSLLTLHYCITFKSDLKQLKYEKKI